MPNLLCSGDQHEQEQVQADALGQQLSATLKLVLQLMKHKFGLTDADTSLLATNFPSEVCKLHCLTHSAMLGIP